MSFDSRPSFPHPVRPSRQSKEGQKETIKQLEKQALIDPLTGAYNRRFFDEQLNSIPHSRHISSATIVVFDADNFKKINDNFGHPEGDKTLKEIVSTINNQIRPGDTLARTGGDEFALILPNLNNPEDIQKFISRLFGAFTENNLSVSFGFATLDKANTKKPIDPKATFNEADQMLLRIKEHKGQ
ncbi:GGDEF domain-containing protein [Patescibacteria group bacterium]|nr:GGDEF domain-containing protein [Patescibacteria group bacterium]